nr:Protein of unknown function DUF2625 [uncultured bacterium]
MDRRSADVLRTVSDPAWPHIQALIEASPDHVEVVSTARSRRDAALEALQVTVGSFLGALVGECGALLVDHGWLRILASGANGLPGVHEANVLNGEPPPLLEVAWDVLGGRFAINGGGLDAPTGDICYWGPDTLDWCPIGGGHADLITWALSGGPSDFYAALRWPGWEQEVTVVPVDHGLSLVPPPFTVQGRDVATTHRAAVPTGELHRFYADMSRQLGDTPDGSAFNLTITE